MIRFTEDCMLGIEELDDEHRHLFELMERGSEILEYHGGDIYDEIKTLIEELEDYAETHFEHEEAYMQKLRDPELISQRVQHNNFRNRIHNWSFAGLDSSEEQEKVLRKIMDFIIRWLYHHIIGSDCMIGHMPSVEEWLLKEDPCRFTDEYLTGIFLIDEEHKELFRLISHINVMVRHGIDEGAGDFDEIKKVTFELHNYVKHHFQDEEEYMESIHYEGLAVQKQAHRAFVAKMEELDFEEIKKNPQKKMEELVEYLTQWLIIHIMKLDKRIGAA